MDVNSTLIGPKPKEGAPINVIDPIFFNFVSQMAHIGIPGLIYLSIAHIAQKYGFFNWKWYGVLIAVGVALAAWKEGWYDPRYENKATRGSGLLDFSCYMIALAIAVAVILI
jgi:hypothetical protein